MKFSDLVPLELGVHELEKGHGHSVGKQFKAVLIRIAGCDAELPTKRFKESEEVR